MMRPCMKHAMDVSGAGQVSRSFFGGSPSSGGECACASTVIIVRSTVPFATKWLFKAVPVQVTNGAESLSCNGDLSIFFFYRNAYRNG